MTIPEGVNHMEFFSVAKTKGIKIQSKFRGVCLNLYRSGAPCWMCRYQSGGKLLFYKRFPFTEQGDKEAGHAYSSYLKENNITERTSKKRKFNKSKS